MPFRKILRKIYYHLPIKFFIKNYILFESNPDYCDNAYYVFKELINEGYNKKYKLIWLVRDLEKFNDVNIDNVYFVDYKNSKKYKRFAKFIIDSNRYINKTNKNQFRIYLSHGMPLKVVPDYSARIGNLNAILITADIFADYYVKYSNKSRETMVVLGNPRNDQFFKEKIKFKELEGFKKVILWMPTYREHLNGSGYKLKSIYGVPSINNKKEIIELNKLLKKYSSLLIIKIHPAQSMENIDKLKLSNIIFVKNELFDTYDKNVYSLAQNTDALITDYSSIYYDYMLMNKPIGMAIEDIEEYKKHFGLYFENLENALPGEYIYNYNDLAKFIENVCNNKDVKKKERNDKINTYNKYVDGNSSKRVVEFLKKHGL